jgi:hypothetical protein
MLQRRHITCIRHIDNTKGVFCPTKKVKGNMSNKQIPNKTKSLSQVIGTVTLAIGLLLTIALPAAASGETQYDDVVINGYTLGFFEQMALEDHIDRDIADGNYWFEMDTGMWGPVGGSAIGYIEVPEDYREYVESRLFNNKPTAEVELAASADECANDCLYW